MFQDTFNAISTGARGQFGRQVVLYVRYGRLIIAKAPRRRPGKGTPGQERTRDTFKEGVAWSQKVRKTPALHAIYKKGLYGALNVHNLAIADAIQAPVIHDIELTDAGIRVTATDNFRVDTVTVAIYSREGKLLETGNAAIQEEPSQWMYMPVTADLRGCDIVVTAKDLPGNSTVKECSLEGKAPIQHCYTNDSQDVSVTVSRPKIVGNGLFLARSG